MIIRIAVFAACVTAHLFAADARPLPRAHAHNDYEHARPLLDALGHGFCNIEADIWLVEGELLVAHSAREITPGRTLTQLYLEPLRERVRQNGGRVHRNGPTIVLLVDVKSEAAATYAALHDVLKSYADILTTHRAGRTEAKAVSVIVSGNRAPDVMARQETRFAGMDGRAADVESTTDLIPWISENVEKVLGRKWTAELQPDEREKLRDFVTRAHVRGRKVRFWNTPDRPDAWALLTDAAVDIIGTDDLAGLAGWMNRRPLE